MGVWQKNRGFDKIEELIMRRDTSLTQLHRRYFSIRVLRESGEDFDAMEEYIVAYRALTIQGIHGLRVNSMEIRTNYPLHLV